MIRMPDLEGDDSDNDEEAPPPHFNEPSYSWEMNEDEDE